MFRSKWKVTCIYHIWDFEDGSGESRLGYIGRMEKEERSLDRVVKEVK